MFAYGQTGSGKTHTMSGYENNDGSLAVSTDSVGVIPRSTRYIFDKLAAMHAAEPGLQATVVATFCEVYNEQVRVELWEAVKSAFVR